MTGVYRLHFDRAYRHVRHYTGYARRSAHPPGRASCWPRRAARCRHHRRRYRLHTGAAVARGGPRQTAASEALWRRLALLPPVQGRGWGMSLLQRIPVAELGPGDEARTRRADCPYTVRQVQPTAHDDGWVVHTVNGRALRYSHTATVLRTAGRCPGQTALPLDPAGGTGSALA